jgi:uncharacterized protein involved in response to NO
MQRAFLSIGFRPFYLGAALLAALAVPLWVVAVLSPEARPWLPGQVPGDALSWHAHEMIFGFAPAVIAGFLLTAVRNWTGRPTPEGGRLAALALLWLAGRVLNLLDPGPLAVLVDAAFLPVLAGVLASPLWQARNTRNAFVVVLLLVLGVANLLHALTIRGWLAAPSPRLITSGALDLILLLMVVIGGRVVPAFSANAVTDLQPRRWPLIEGLAIGGIGLILVADLAGWSGTPVTWLLRALAVVHLVRLLGWQPWKTRADPLLLVLPLAYLWIPLHLLLRAELPAVATHAMTVGAMASLMLAMMTRSALGHTGRPLRAGGPELVSFIAIQVAALCRVFGPVLAPGAYDFWIAAATVGWSTAFGAFVLAYWPRLTRPRIDEATPAADQITR